jgi:hypothetical protein
VEHLNSSDFENAKNSPYAERWVAGTKVFTNWYLVCRYVNEGWNGMHFCVFRETPSFPSNFLLQEAYMLPMSEFEED